MLMYQDGTPVINFPIRPSSNLTTGSDMAEEKLAPAKRDDTEDFIAKLKAETGSRLDGK